MKNLLLILITLFVSNVLLSQVSGVVTEANGNVIPFVTVYVEGTSTGTISNMEGQYSLVLEPGDYNLVYSFIGYKSVVKSITIDRELELDVVLYPQTTQLEVIEVSTNAEDPAYRVIREAIKHRENNKNNIEKYEVDLYVKGLVKMLDTPSSFMGQKVDDMDGMLDSVGQGIVYLAESQSKIYHHQPDLRKEIMYSSIVAEDDGTFNFNRFFGANYDIYDEYFLFYKSLINPLADNALLYYNYKMIEAKVDDKGRMVNRIAVIPKSDVKPTLFGELYIIENEWTVKQLDLSFTGKSVKQQLFDTIQIKQIHLPLAEEKWMMFSQTLEFTLGGFGFKVGGGFSSVFTGYNINPDFDKSFFDNETFTMDAGAVKTDSSFWSSVRPIQLTKAEKENYIKKDSLKKVWASKEYQDSIDQKGNQFELVNLLFGYTYNQSWKKRSYSINSPLSYYHFNTVEGHALKGKLSYSQNNEDNNSFFNANADLGYGFSDKRFKWKIGMMLHTNRTFMERWALNIGDVNTQFNERNPVTVFGESITTLLGEVNNGRFFRKKFADLSYEREVVNGLFLRTKMEYSKRSPIGNTSNYSIFDGPNPYAHNIPFGFLNATEQDFFDTHNSLKFSLDLRIRIGQKYASYPKFRLRSVSKFPDIWINYEKGIALGNTDYDKLTLRFAKVGINSNILGYSNIHIEASSFLRKPKMEFIDYHHFHTNNNFFSFKQDYFAHFKRMPHYHFSTTKDYVAFYFEHIFEGFLLDNIPFIKKMGWETVVTGNTLVRKGASNYYEVSAGIHKVRIKGINLFRLDYVWGFEDRLLIDKGIVFSISRGISL